MADLNKLLTYLIEQLPSNKLLQVFEHIQSKKTGTNDYLSCEEFLDNIWNRDELRKIYEIKVGENEDEGKVDSEKEDAVKIDANNEDGISVNKWNEIFKTKEIGIDYRIKKIEFEKLKYYPEKVNDYLFGTSFVDLKGNPKSALILGNNGVGKTSIYQAIELLFRNQIGEVFLRDYGRNKNREESIGNLCKEYLANKDYSIDEITAFIETVGNVTTINIPLSFTHKSLKKYFTNYFFISDYEIYKLGRLKFDGGNNNSFRMFMGESMDIGELLWFNKLMGELSCYGKKNEDKNANEVDSKEEDAKIKEKKEKEKEIESFKNEILQFKEEIVQLYEERTEISELIAELEESKQNEISDLLNSFIKLLKQDDTGSKSERKIYISKIKTILNEITSFKNSIENENENIKDLVIFESLLKSNESLLTVLKEIECEIFIDVFEDTILFRKKYDLFLNNIRLPQNIKYTTSEYKNERKNIIEAIKTRTSSDHIKELINGIIESSIKEGNIKEDEFKKEVIDQLNSDAEKIFNVINSRITVHFNKSVEVAVKTIDEVMKMFLDKNKEELEWIDEDLKNDDFVSGKYPQYLSLKMNLKENGKNLKIGVKRYFNTFRYRMFSILLVISTSFAIMKKFNINLPIVIDDVFHANDFINRYKIYGLINLIIESHKNIFGGSQELQLIVFTHDDLIFNSIRKYILEKNNKCKNDNINFGFYRLLGYEHAEKDDANKINNVIYEFK